MSQHSIAPLLQSCFQKYEIAQRSRELSSFRVELDPIAIAKNYQFSLSLSLSLSLRFLYTALEFFIRLRSRFTGADSAATRRGSIDEFRGVAGVEFAVPARTCGMSLVLTPANPWAHARTRTKPVRLQGYFDFAINLSPHRRETSILQGRNLPAPAASASAIQFTRAPSCLDKSRIRSPSSTLTGATRDSLLVISKTTERKLISVAISTVPVTVMKITLYRKDRSSQWHW